MSARLSCSRIRGGTARSMVLQRLRIGGGEDFRRRRVRSERSADGGASRARKAEAGVAPRACLHLCAISPRFDGGPALGTRPGTVSRDLGRKGRARGRERYSKTPRDALCDRSIPQPARMRSSQPLAERASSSPCDRRGATRRRSGSQPIRNSGAATLRLLDRSRGPRRLVGGSGRRENTIAPLKSGQ